MGKHDTAQGANAPKKWPHEGFKGGKGYEKVGGSHSVQQLAETETHPRPKGQGGGMPKGVK